MSTTELWQGEPVQLESVPCDLCGSTQSRVELQAPDQMRFVPGRFTVVRCTNCGLAYQSPRTRTDQLSRVYPNDYAPHQDLRSPHDLPPLVRWGRTVERAAASGCYGEPSRPTGRQGAGHLPSLSVLLARLMQLVVLPPIQPDSQGSSRVLDIGCGTGRFLARMKLEGWDVQGVEMDREAAEHATALLGVPVVNRPFGPGLFQPRSFCLVTMWNVLEHLASPLESLREVARLLKPGGWLVALVPNLNSAEVHLAGDKAFLLDLPRHLYHFEARTLSAMTAKAGLRLVRLVYPIEPTSLYISIGRRLGTLRGFSLRRDHIWRRRLLWPLCALLSWSGSGGQMAVIARNPEGLD